MPLDDFGVILLLNLHIGVSAPNSLNASRGIRSNLPVTRRLRFRSRFFEPNNMCKLLDI